MFGANNQVRFLRVTCYNTKQPTHPSLNLQFVINSQHDDVEYAENEGIRAVVSPFAAALLQQG
jgi:hypothetical protein